MRVCWVQSSVDSNLVVFGKSVWQGARTNERLEISCTVDEQIVQVIICKIRRIKVFDERFLVAGR